MLIVLVNIDASGLVERSMMDAEYYIFKEPTILISGILIALFYY